MKENNTTVHKLIKEQVETCVREMNPNMAQSRRNNIDKKNVDSFHWQFGWPRFPCSLFEGDTFHIEWP